MSELSQISTGTGQLAAMLDTLQIESKANSKVERNIEIDGSQAIVHIDRQNASGGSFKIKWKFPAHNVKGVWQSNSLHDKRLRADWELDKLQSRISVHAPVVCIYGHDDSNVLTFASSDTIHTTNLRASVREEDSHIYCEVECCVESVEDETYYVVDIFLNQSSDHFSSVLASVADWWTKDKSSYLPASAFDPVYSTWCSYHQNLKAKELIRECELASALGYKTIIVDDGWQTLDTNRGYDFTGDWNPDRIPEMRDFVNEVHNAGMKIMLWYSVPFCGVKSLAYNRFKGKFLTEDHRWAPVFDPRYSDVRGYIVDIYSRALKEWEIDGFKLDFIDDFKRYPETIMKLQPGMDTSSINDGVYKLLAEIHTALTRIKPDVLIEFRQNYIGPSINEFGNMFRAFDCPNDSITNRIRTTDLRMTIKDKAIHSDMITWHYDESVELAALQFQNIMFSVPQVSVRLGEIPEDHLSMLRYLTNFWLDNQNILMNGDFTPARPSSNYPVLRAALDDCPVLK